ncbi:putative zinc metalloprotease Rip3 [Enhygromyxa salina]|uniref:Zinc metalloprotease n=1 Tax=Enhygromyxa salina TaxID=215803 RepID=A0A2S9Y7N7_9BACT|nr:site-2 protease family protein [Enhygromyxa salina]PRQ01041.1 putative zinc metalloprotease Rip3 [Enhygromyxa salina]
MKWAWRIGRVAGIDIRVHVTFLALLAWIAWISYATTGTAAGAIDGVILVCLVFGIIVLHELGHALTARRFGIRTRDITLLPIGGVASLERMPEDPRHELLVALAGPAVNVVLASLLAVVALGLGEPLVPGALDQSVSMVVRLMWINVILALFNLLPAFPMDGGRALRAVLALRLSDLRATQIAAGLGQAMAVAFGIIGLFGNPLLVFIALFLWMGASGEARVAEAKFVAHGVPVAAAMVRDFEAVSPRAPVLMPLRRVIETFQHDFPVVDDGRVVGMLSREALLQALAAHGPEVSVAEVMRSEPKIVHPSDNLDDALMRVMQDGEPMSVVDSQGRLVGMLTGQSVTGFLTARQVLRKRAERGQRLPGGRMELPVARILEQSATTRVGAPR